jgi:hypothetical protein
MSRATEHLSQQELESYLWGPPAIATIRALRASALRHFFGGGQLPKTLVPGDQRTGGLSETWRRAKLADISRVVRGSTPRPGQDPRFFGGTHTPWITVGEVTKDDSPFLTHTESGSTPIKCCRTRVREDCPRNGCGARTAPQCSNADAHRRESAPMNSWRGSTRASDSCATRKCWTATWRWVTHRRVAPAEGNRRTGSGTHPRQADQRLLSSGGV